MQKYAKILGTGSFLPAKVVTNKELESMVDTTDEWIVDRTGISSRHVASDSETVVTMGLSACERALAYANKSASDVQLIIVATTTPAQFFPSTACVIQEKLGAPIGIAFDVQAACSGFLYALSLADTLIKAGTVKSALVVGSEIMSRLVNWSDRNTCVLFGDGAGAVYLEASDEPGILSTHLFADGSYSQLLKVNNLQGMVKDGSVHTDPFLFMDGRRVFKIAVSRLEEMVTKTLEANNISSVDWLIPHQANLRIISATADKLKMSMDRVVCTVSSHANTSGASVPLALDTAVRDGRIQRGQYLLLEAFGAGLTWGSALVRF